MLGGVKEHAQSPREDERLSQGSHPGLSSPEPAQLTTTPSPSPLAAPLP